MSETSTKPKRTFTKHVHLHDSEGKHVGDVCGGTGNHYRVYTHIPGDHYYHQWGKPTVSQKVAMRQMCEAMLTNQYNRVAVALCADYYDPSFIYEVTRR